jgi:hypothetical protein
MNYEVKVLGPCPVRMDINEGRRKLFYFSSE